MPSKCVLCGRKFADPTALLQHLKSGLHRPGAKLDAATQALAPSVQLLAARAMTGEETPPDDVLVLADVVLHALDGGVRQMARQLLDYGCTDYGDGSYFRVPERSDLADFLRELAK